MCESENLIMCVEKFPCIWNIYDSDYHNRDLKDLAWEQICKELFKDSWETCTEKSNKLAELKKKWVNIRDYYRKEVNKTQNATSGSAAKKVKKYIYSDLLHFLTPIFKKRNTDGNDPEDDHHHQSPRLDQNELEENENDTEGQVYSTPDFQPHVSTACEPHKKKKDVPSEILNILKNKQKLSSTVSTEDDDTKFLLSFRSDMKKMKTSQKIDFKMGMLQLVKKICMQYDPPSPQSPICDNLSSQCSHFFSPSPVQQKHIPKSSQFYNNSSTSTTIDCFSSHSQHVQPNYTKPKPKPIIIHSISNFASTKPIVLHKPLKKEYHTPDSNDINRHSSVVEQNNEESEVLEEEHNLQRYLKFD